MCEDDLESSPMRPPSPGALEMGETHTQVHPGYAQHEPPRKQFTDRSLDSHFVTEDIYESPPEYTTRFCVSCPGQENARFDPQVGLLAYVALHKMYLLCNVLAASRPTSMHLHPMF